MCRLVFSLAFLSIFGCQISALPLNSPTTPPLKYRIVSFHRGRADKDLIRLAHRLGFNEVQIQLEGSNTTRLKEFAERDSKEGYVKLCHDLGMEISLWIHELSDIPQDMRPVSVENEKLWKMLNERYEWVLGELLPEIDCLVLTVVETEIDATDAALMRRLTEVIDAKCRKYNKRFVVRTFVHHPEQFEGVMECIKGLPEDTIIMSKVVPQDWQMRGMNDAAIGAVGNREQIIEYDIAGEYFQKSNVANCFPDVLLRQFHYGLSKGVDGICVRVDRDDHNVLGYPQEVNLWALGFAAAGKTDSLDEIWKAYTETRFGKEAAPCVTAALKPTGEVIAEATCVGPFTFGDTRSYPPTADRDAFKTNWNNWRWDPATYMTRYERSKAGDPLITTREERATAAAIRSAEDSLKKLEECKDKLKKDDYELLNAKLRANLDYLTVMSRIQLAYLRLVREFKTTDPAEKAKLRDQLKTDLAEMKKLHLNAPAPVKVKVNGKETEARIRLIDLKKWVEYLELKVE